MTDDLLNPNATPGHNEAPDYARETTNQMARDYALQVETLEKLLVEARALPARYEMDDAQGLLNCGALIKRFKDLDTRIENIRVTEGEPHLRRKNAIDAFFFGIRDKIGRRNKNDRQAKAGVTDILQARIDDAQERRLAAERARLEEARQKAAREAEAARQKALAEAKAAEEARLVAERARKPVHIETKSEIADEKAGDAAAAASIAEAAEQAFDDANFAASAKPADLLRLRGNDDAGGGVTLTSARVAYAEMIDRSKLDMKALWPFFTDAEIEKALRAWAKTTGHRVAMDGASIGHRNKGVTR